MIKKTFVELDKYGRLLVNGFDKFADKLLLHVLAILFYVVPLTLGLLYCELLKQSPLVKFSSYILGFFASVISWVIAKLTAHLVFGMSDFPKEVFLLYSNDDFSISVALVFLFLPISKFLARILNRTVTSYIYRKWIFSVAVISIIATLGSTIEYMNFLNNTNAYIFGFSVVGIFYFAMFMQKNEIRKPGIRPGVNNFRSNFSNSNTGSFENLFDRRMNFNNQEDHEFH